MTVYYSMLILSILALFMVRTTLFKYAPRLGYTYSTKPIIVYSTLAYIAFFISLRDVVLDTYAYISMFDSMPIAWEDIVLIAHEQQHGFLFYIIAGIFKMTISDSHYVWLSFLCIVSLLCLFSIYRKYSCDYAFTFFLFIASTNFIWLLNGTRQFLVVCILVAYCECMLKDRGHKLFYLLLIFVLSSIHHSCIFLLPISLICSRGKMLDMWMLMFVIATVVGTIFLENFIGVTASLMGKEYEMLEEDSGSHIIRLVIALIPVVLVLLKLKTVKSLATPMIVLAVNMSLVGACFFFASTFTSGILVGRMPIYFTVYNFILLPWLLKYCFRNNILRTVCIVCYCAYFYYQMVITWHELPYVSYILGIS